MYNKEKFLEIYQHKIGKVYKRKKLPEKIEDFFSVDDFNWNFKKEVATLSALAGSLENPRKTIIKDNLKLSASKKKLHEYGFTIAELPSSHDVIIYPGDLTIYGHFHTEDVNLVVLGSLKVDGIIESDEFVDYTITFVAGNLSCQGLNSSSSIIIGGKCEVEEVICIRSEGESTLYAEQGVFTKLFIDDAGLLGKKSFKQKLSAKHCFEFDELDDYEQLTLSKILKKNAFSQGHFDTSMEKLFKKLKKGENIWLNNS